jgi:peptidoglycan-associated lipoprotein
MNHRFVVAGLLAVSTTLIGCKKKPVALDPVPVTGSTVGGTSAADAERAARERAIRDSLARLAADSAARAASAAEAASLRAILEAPVLFDYDAAEVTDAGRVALDAKLPILRSNPGIRIRVSGHTDSRGSDEYNLALGLRRAAAARKYLSDRGIAAARIDVVSFGEERPASAGEDEGAFSKNRRGEFEILSGGEAMKVPR